MNGATIGVVFGCAWGIAGATALLAPWHSWAIGSSIGISIVLVVALSLAQKRRTSGTFRGRIYGIAVVFEVVAIVATIWLLKLFGLPHLLMPAAPKGGAPITKSRIGRRRFDVGSLRKSASYALLKNSPSLESVDALSQ